MENKEISITKKAMMTATIFHRIYYFLSLKDLAIMMLVNIEFYKLANEHFKLLLEKFHLVDIDPFTNSSLQKTLLEQEKEKLLDKKYNLEYKKFFCREILMINGGNLYNFEYTKVVRYNKLVGKGVNNLIFRKFEIGVIFSSFLLFDQTLLYTTTQLMTDPIILPQFCSMSQVKQFSTVGKQLVCLQENYTISIIFYENNEFIVKNLKYSMSKKILEIRVSGNYIIMLENDNKLSVFSYIELQTQTFEEEENKRLGHLIMEPTEIIDFGVTNSMVFIAAKNGALYECEINQIVSQDPSLGVILLKVQRNEFFKNKKISHIYCQMFFYFLLEEEYIKSIDQWTNQEVVDWANEIGFEDYTKIIKYENIIGKDLVNCDKQLMLIDRLGLTREDLQTKFVTEINQNLKGRIKKQVVWGAGANNFGQLGLDGAVQYNQPQKINLKLDSGEIVYKIECGWKHTGIITSKGKIFVSHKQAKQQQTDVIKKIDKEATSKKKEDIKSLKKYLKEETQTTNQDSSPWIDITPFFQNLKDYRQYQLLDISIAKDTISVLGIFKGTSNEELIRKKNKSKQVFENNQKQQPVKQKFKPATQILDRIQWDTNLNPKDFIVAYEDRFLGVIEVPFEDFIQTEVKDHRIQYFKKKGEIIWDRNSKTNLF